MEAYVLVTPARNEASYLPKVIESILAQTVKPIKWVIVNDGSTDKTDDIVATAARANSFIELISVSSEAERSFGSKALAFKMGYASLQDIAFDYIGNLDADVTMESHYYQMMLDAMSKNSKLGVASGVLWDKKDTGFKRTTSSLNHAVGAVQFWRRKCFVAVGGYRPATIGGVDSIAELTARMKGWETRSFPDIAIFHHKPVDSANGKNGIRIAYRAGLTEYYIGTYPPFAVLKAIRRWKYSPVLLTSLVRIFAYGQLWLNGTPRDASIELVNYLKNEQKALIKQTFIEMWKGR